MARTRCWRLGDGWNLRWLGAGDHSKQSCFSCFDVGHGSVRHHLLDDGMALVLDEICVGLFEAAETT